MLEASTLRLYEIKMTAGAHSRSLGTVVLGGILGNLQAPASHRAVGPMSGMPERTPLRETPPFSACRPRFLALFTWDGNRTKLMIINSTPAGEIPAGLQQRHCVYHVQPGPFSRPTSIPYT